MDHFYTDPFGGYDITACDVQDLAEVLKRRAQQNRTQQHKGLVLHPSDYADEVVEVTIDESEESTDEEEDDIRYSGKRR